MAAKAEPAKPKTTVANILEEDDEFEEFPKEGHLSLSLLVYANTTSENMLLMASFPNRVHTSPRIQSNAQKM